MRVAGVLAHRRRGRAMRRQSEAFAQHLRQLSVICFALMTGISLFGGIVWYLLNGGGFTPPDGIPGYLSTLLNVLALLAIVKALFLPRLFPPPPRDASEEGLLAWHQRATIIGFALRDGAAMMALVGVLITGQQPGGFAVAGLAVLSMGLSWPRANQILAP